MLSHSGGRERELAMHRQFDEWRAEGEWFYMGRPLIRWIIETRERFPRGQADGTMTVTALKALRRDALADPPPRPARGAEYVRAARERSAQLSA
jgi:hypothetical protein